MRGMRDSAMMSPVALQGFRAEENPPGFKDPGGLLRGDSKGCYFDSLIRTPGPGRGNSSGPGSETDRK